MLEQIWNYKAALEKAYAREVEPVCQCFHLTRTELDILLFLANNKQFDTASDIVEKKKISKSHVSESIKYLEERGFLTRSYRDNNRRTIHLTLCEEADEIIKRGQEAQGQFLRMLFQGFSSEDMKQIQMFLKRMSDNTKSYLE